MAQPREEIADRSQRVGRAVSILNVGGVHLRANQMTAGISNDVALAPVDLLAGVISPRTSAFRSLDRLTVDHPCRGAGFAAIPLPSLLDQQEIDLFPQPIRLPRIKITLHGRPLRKIARQPTPRTRRPQNVEQSVDNPPKWNYSRPSQGLSAPADAAKSAPIPHPSCHLHSADLPADTAPERFQSASCVPHAI